MIEVVQLAEKELIEQEDSVIDKIGELSSTMVRMNTVRSHDENIFWKLIKDWPKIRDVDLSEAIMQLTEYRPLIIRLPCKWVPNCSILHCLTICNLLITFIK